MKTDKKLMQKFRLYGSLGVAFLSASLVGMSAQAVDEVETNDSTTSAQGLTIVAEGSATGSAMVNGVIGNLTGSPVFDLDFYSFRGQEGDVVTVDIDGGMRSGERDVDTVIAIFGSDNLKLRENDDGAYPVDPGSVHPYDSRIDNFRLPSSGVYTVGVSSYPRRFADVGGDVLSTRLGRYSNGDYALIISGVTPAVMQINIDIKPGNSTKPSPINPKSKGRIPVALLSSSEFDAVSADVGSLRFGPTGTEASAPRCNPKGRDVNDDGLLDLVCHFDNPTAAFSASDEEGMVTGKAGDGRPFEGRGLLKVVPQKRSF